MQKNWLFQTVLEVALFMLLHCGEVHLSETGILQMEQVEVEMMMFWSVDVCDAEVKAAEHILT